MSSFLLILVFVKDVSEIYGRYILLCKILEQPLISLYFALKMGSSGLHRHRHTAYKASL